MRTLRDERSTRLENEPTVSGSRSHRFPDAMKNGHMDSTADDDGCPKDDQNADVSATGSRVVPLPSLGGESSRRQSGTVPDGALTSDMLNASVVPNATTSKPR